MKALLFKAPATYNRDSTAGKSSAPRNPLTCVRHLSSIDENRPTRSRSWPNYQDGNTAAEFVGDGILDLHPVSGITGDQALGRITAFS